MSHLVRAFPKDARLLTKGDFKRVFENPIRSAGPLFLVLGCGNSTGQPRLGLAISRKCSRRAVDRNRLKRIVRETFRLFPEHLGSVDYVVLCRSAAVHRTNHELTEALAIHLRKVRLKLCGRS